ncbi:MAG: pentapeptide repeat-containing protein [Moorea sp. SIO3G5]|nr:pentapeptide repeat-containing protein [Moorena sp. SIO3G5]
MGCNPANYLSHTSLCYEWLLLRTSRTAFINRSTFKKADLTDAVFEDAFMSKSKFKGADITGADFTFAILDYNQDRKLCKKASGKNTITGVETKDSLFCY